MYSHFFQDDAMGKHSVWYTLNYLHNNLVRLNYWKYLKLLPWLFVVWWVHFKPPLPPLDLKRLAFVVTRCHRHKQCLTSVPADYVLAAKEAPRNECYIIAGKCSPFVRPRFILNWLVISPRHVENPPIG